ncbi:DUF3040 domain-containing protein [Frigoribacterium sp. 2-23]|uniref:DUF3040 domain-containing protein n=1 Tax=Frigoribacterium sp. 2-23 TaxID=3415006 RepID=UPI003C705A23
MPLSEQEQRLLDEMERSLYNNDSDFVATVGTRRGRPNYTLIVLGVLGALVGIAVIVAGVIFRQPLIGVAGFVLMLAGALFAIAPPQRRGSTHIPAAPSPRSSTSRPTGVGKAHGGGLMDRLNERWDRRQDGDGRH